MPTIKFSKEEKEILSRKLQGYLQSELDLDIGQFDAEFLLDFISNEMGAYFYNKGLYDAKDIVSKKIDNITESIFDVEIPTEFHK